MKGRIIVTRWQGDDPIKAALIVDGRLDDLIIATPPGEPGLGEVYWAKVDRVVPKIGGAFVQLTPTTQGFLREGKGLRQGQGILVQATGYGEPHKAIPVTTKILRKGLRFIYTPGAPGLNFSKAIRDAEYRDDARQALMAPDTVTFAPEMKDLCHTLMLDRAVLSEPNGGIVRSSAPDFPLDELVIEAAWLRTQYEEAADHRSADAPGTGKPLPPVPMIAHWLDPLPDAIIEPKSAVSLTSVRGNLCFSRQALERVEAWDGDPFDHFGVWDEIDRLAAPEVDLPSGGWMAIESTRAMVTVDVNTAGEFSDGAGMAANIEAARELPRQLRLRGLGGQIVIDFAPLKKMHRKKIEEVLKAAFRRDPIATTLAGWTPLGNFELQRKRERRPLAEVL